VEVKRALSWRLVEERKEVRAREREGKETESEGQISLSLPSSPSPLNPTPFAHKQLNRAVAHSKSRLTLVSVLSPLEAAVSSFASSFLGLGASFFAGAALSGSGALGLSSLGDDDETSLGSLLGSDWVLEVSSVGAAFDARERGRPGFNGRRKEESARARGRSRENEREGGGADVGMIGSR